TLPETMQAPALGCVAGSAAAAAQGMADNSKTPLMIGRIYQRMAAPPCARGARARGYTKRRTEAKAARVAGSLVRQRMEIAESSATPPEPFASPYSPSSRWLPAVRRTAAERARARG